MAVEGIQKKSGVIKFTVGSCANYLPQKWSARTKLNSDFGLAAAAEHQLSKREERSSRHQEKVAIKLPQSFLNPFNGYARGGNSDSAFRF